MLFKRFSIIACLTIFLCIVSVHISKAQIFTYHWEMDESPSGSESMTILEPLEVKIIDEPIKVSYSTAALKLRQEYGVYLSHHWNNELAQLLLLAFESVPRYWVARERGLSYWALTNGHLPEDIVFAKLENLSLVSISTHAFNFAGKRLAKIDGIRGRFFSRRLHHAVVRYVTDNGNDRRAVDGILHERYGLSVKPSDYQDLTRNTTGEHSGRFMPFKSEELLSLISMLEEYPSGMLKTPGLKYIVRRLDGTLHPLYPQAGAVAWVTEGYIEFMEGAFKGGNSEHIHRLILHEKAHFLWHYLFDVQLKQDWIKLGGWKKNGNEWFTTKQLEFVSAYAHGENPNEDMAESISYYIVNPDKLRSRSPVKYQFIQDRVMHGTRYISKIREDLTFEVYNLYPDYIYPGQIVMVDVKVEGDPEADKLLTVNVKIHGESEFDTARGLYVRLYPIDMLAGISFDLRLGAIDKYGNRVSESHSFRGERTVSKYTKNGYWSPKNITIEDKNNLERHQNKRTFGWQCYVNNPLEDLEPPQYVKDSMELLLSDALNSDGEAYQIITATWEIIEKSGIDRVNGSINDEYVETYSRKGVFDYGRYDAVTGKVSVDFIIPDYLPSGRYTMNSIGMKDIAHNSVNITFTDKPDIRPGNQYFHLDEIPKSIIVQTTNPDLEPPILDVNRITISSEPTVREFPNGETIVDINFLVRDNISGYRIAGMYLRDPHGTNYHFYHYHKGRSYMYPKDNPNIYKEYHQRIILPVGSVPGIWGLKEMTLWDRASNHKKYDFTEIVRFEIVDSPAAPQLISGLPEITMLLPNYPNPFNPETWIPYQLSNSSNVRISIYSVDGNLVRNLNLGYQQAGNYQAASKAAYWNGKNDIGEQVVSGVYFYTLFTNEFSDTRKMVILK